MLTGDLVRVRVVKKDLHPSFIDPCNRRLVERAGTLLGMVEDALEHGWTRGRIDEEIRAITGVDVDHKITKGLAKILLDKGEFETLSPTNPAELRWAVFCEAAKMGPLARKAGKTRRTTAKDVYAVVAKDLGTTAKEVSQGLYADLKDEQVLQGIPLPDPQTLLHRYNTALVQAILLKASRLTVELTDPDPKYVRQLMRFLKFHQLMYRSEQTSSGFRFVVDGPQSLLKLSTRYGLQLANFLPGVLLQPGEWRLSAEVLWGKKRKLRKMLHLSSEMELKSHYKDTGTWTSRTEQWFMERYEKYDTDWTVGPGEPIDLGQQHMLIPDLTFKKDGRVGHLEILGFWRAKHLKDRLAELPDNVIVAVSSKLKGEAGALAKSLDTQVIRFAEVIPPAKVVERLEKIAR
jgi:predicted nuclease of restriction endonuclease-like RecB superfamily